MAKPRRENTAQTQPNREGVNPRSKRVIRVGQAARMRPVSEREEVMPGVMTPEAGSSIQGPTMRIEPDRGAVPPDKPLPASKEEPSDQ